MFRKPRSRPGKMGFKVDKEATARRLPAFADKRSFISLDGHEILFGLDKSQRRREIWQRANGRCEMQLIPGCRGFANFENGISMSGWAHVSIPPHRHHCDCKGGGLWTCGPCHRYYHAHKREAEERLRSKQT